MPDQTTKARAQILWDAMDGNEKTGVRFGLFPAEKMRQAEAEGFNGREICIALMEIAGRNGGMKA